MTSITSLLRILTQGSSTVAPLPINPEPARRVPERASLYYVTSAKTNPTSAFSMKESIVYGTLRVYSVTILCRHYFELTKRTRLINKVFRSAKFPKNPYFFLFVRKLGQVHQYWNSVQLIIDRNGLKYSKLECLFPFPIPQNSIQFPYHFRVSFDTY